MANVGEDNEPGTAIFKGRPQATGSFPIGCDGVKSSIRTVFIKMRGKFSGVPTYTGLTQICFLLSPTSHGALDPRFGLKA